MFSDVYTSRTLELATFRPWWTSTLSTWDGVARLEISVYLICAECGVSKCCRSQVSGLGLLFDRNNKPDSFNSGYFHMIYFNWAPFFLLSRMSTVFVECIVKLNPAEKLGRVGANQLPGRHLRVDRVPEAEPPEHTSVRLEHIRVWSNASRR